MKNTHQTKSTSSFAIATGCALMALVGQSYGARDVVSAFTDDGSFGLTSVTINGTAYTNLTGATADIRNSTSGFRGLFYNGTADVTIATLDAASTGLNYKDAAANLWTESKFQFGQVIQATDQIFLFDFGPGDAVKFGLLNSSGNLIGDYSITFASGDFNATDLIAPASFDTVSTGDAYTRNQGTLPQRSIAFQLSDFIGTTGDPSTATGIKIIGSNTSLDPTVVGLASVPEPGTYALLAGLTALASIAMRRRR